MKKKITSLVFLTPLLITGCGIFGNNESDEPKGPRFYENSPFDDEYEDDDGTDYSNLFVLDNSKTDFCLVLPKVKQYCDDMNEQREKGNWLNEDKINDLHGDTVKIKSYQGDYDKCVPVELSFEVADTISSEDFAIICWPKGDKEHYRESVAVGGKASFDNLLRGTAYEWRVLSSSGKKSAIGTFKTDDYVRFLSVGDLFNVRDCGGWTTVDGKRIKQGLLYRGGEINDRQWDVEHHKNIYGDDDPARDIFVKDLGIRVELDLRNPKEAHNITECPINKSGVDKSNPEYVTYALQEIDPYANGLITSLYQDTLRVIFEEYIANVDKKPIYCNCYGGADRTGTLCFLVGALLGMSYTDLIIDYEATTFSTNYKAHDVSQKYSNFPEMIEAIKNWSFYDETKPLKEIVETFLVSTCGVSKDCINKIRNIMLEDPVQE